MARLERLAQNKRTYPLSVQLVAYFVAAAAFCRFFEGSALDCLFSGISGTVVGICLLSMSRLGANGFFKTIAASAISAFLSLCCALLCPSINTDAIIIGAYMALVPGVAFTTALRDIMAGDLVSGIAKCAEGIFIAVAIAVGTGLAMSLMRVWTGG